MFLTAVVTGFVAHNGAKFYGLPLQTQKVRLVKKEQVVPSEFPFGDDSSGTSGSVVPFWANKTIRWSLEF